MHLAHDHGLFAADRESHDEAAWWFSEAYALSEQYPTSPEKRSMLLRSMAWTALQMHELDSARSTIEMANTEHVSCQGLLMALRIKAKMGTPTKALLPGLSKAGKKYL